MILAILILTFLLLLNGLFAMSELAVMTSRQSRLQQAAKAGSKGAATALTLAREPTRFLSTIQVGITLIGILAGALGENAISGRLEPIVARVPAFEPHADIICLVIVVLLITYFSLVIGELVPKRIALAYPEAAATAMARPLNALSLIAAWPIRFLSFSTDRLLRLLRVKQHIGDDVSEEDVNALIARAAGTGVLTPQEHRLFHRIMRAGDLRVGDLMIPRREIVWIDVDEPVESIRILIGTSTFSHFPVCRGSLDQLIGVVHVKDLIAYGLLAEKDFKIAAVAHKPLCVPETLPALRLLDLFQSNRMHVAFVVDEYGGTQGMLTLNDVTSTIVGDMYRSGESASAAMVMRADGSWLIDGRLPLHKLVVGLNLPFEVEEEQPDVNTAGGLMTSLLGHIPTEGERVAWQGYMIEVVDMDGARVDKLLASRIVGEDAAESEPTSQ